MTLQPTFKGASIKRKEPIFWEHEGNRAIREGKWKLVAKEDKPWELYDMERDRTEMNNLAEKNPKKAQALAAKWDSMASRLNVLPLGSWRGKPEPAKRKGKSVE